MTVVMEPVEINAGAWYLRALRAEDRPALAELGETDVDYTAYSWALCEPTTGELLAEIVLDPRPGGRCRLQPAAQRMVLAGLRSTVAEANTVVTTTGQQGGDIADQVHALGYTTGKPGDRNTQSRSGVTAKS